MENELCNICNEQKSLCHGICPFCHYTSIEKNKVTYSCDNSKISPRDFYYDLIEVKIHHPVNESYLLKVRELRDYLFDNWINIRKIMSDLESMCKCGKIVPKKLAFGTKPHEIMCSTCKIFCSNCSEHHNPEETSCEQIKQIKKDFESKFTQNWLKLLAFKSKERERISREIEAENKSLEYIKQLDMFKCPFTEYETAKEYIRKYTYIYDYNSFEKEEKLLAKYTKDTWRQVSCKMEPFTIVNCNDIICGRCHPDRVAHELKLSKTVGIYPGCCGRRLRAIKCNSDDIEIFKPSQLIKISESSFLDISLKGYSKELKKCDGCGSETDKIFFECSNVNCLANGELICIECWIRAHNKKDSFSIDYYNQVFENCFRENHIFEISNLEELKREFIALNTS